MYTMISPLKYVRVLAVAGCLILLFCGCAEKPDPDTADTTSAQQAATETCSVSDKVIPEFQLQLVNLAFEAAASIPANPFIKDRSRVQEKVIDACLELGQPVRAVRYADKIENWRRGLCYAKAAVALAQNGYPAEQVGNGLDLAEKIAAMDHGQKWRSDRIKAHIAHAYTVLGNHEKAGQFRENLEGVETTELVDISAEDSAVESFDEQAGVLDEMIATGTFDATVQALNGYASLFNTFYGERDKRNSAEQKIKNSWDLLQVMIRMELLMAMADFALNHNDPNKAGSLADEAQAFLDDYTWQLRDRIPHSAMLLILQYKSGDQDKARQTSDAVLKLFNEKKHTEHIIYHPEMLYSLAEASHAIGDHQTALTMYKQALDACSENPKSLTRSEDFSAVCCSMALRGVEPDAELWNQMNTLYQGLGEPW